MTINDKPSSIFDDDAANSKVTNKANTKEKLLQRALAVIDDKTILSRDKSGKCYITFPEGNTYDTLTLNDARASAMIKRVALGAMQVRLPKPIISELLEELQEKANTPAVECLEVHHRVAPGSNGRIFVDLCDENRAVLEVDMAGYRHYDFETESPLFLRPRGMMPLPDPVGHIGNLRSLRDFVNVPSDDAWRLLIVYLLFSFRPSGPYVILIISGTAGSSKSTFSRVIRRLLDPSSVSTQSIPKSTVDLMITATNSHLLAFDNVRELNHEISDAFCRLATGGGMRVRALFTDSDEALFHAKKPCLLNGIGDIASQPDLLSRCIQLNLPTIKVRRTEEEFDRSFEESIGPIFAGLMDALSKTLAAVPGVTDVPETRMADFSHWGIAVERALNWPEGSFKKAYAQNQEEQMSNTLEDDPLAQAIKALMLNCAKTGAGKRGTPTDLLKGLAQYATKSNLWPKSPHSLSKRLKKMEPALRACGIGLEFAHSGNRSITLTRLDGFKK